MQKQLQILDDVTGLLLSVNVATPIIFATVASISAILKAFTGAGPSLKELADRIELQTGKNETVITAEIERLKALEQ